MSKEFFRTKKGLNVAPNNPTDVSSPESGDIIADSTRKNVLRKYSEERSAWLDVGVAGIGGNLFPEFDSVTPSITGTATATLSTSSAGILPVDDNTASTLVTFSANPSTVTWSKTIPADLGATKAVFRAWIKCGENNINLSLIVNSVTVSTLNVENSTTWKKYEIPFETVANTSVQIRLSTSGTVASGQIFIDEVYVGFESPADELFWNADDGTKGWGVYKDAANARPVDGIGGSPSVTFSTSSTTPLSGTRSFIFNKPASNVQGEGASVNFKIERAQLARVLKIEFDYIVSSGTFTAGTSTTDSDVIVYIYDVTNNQLIEPSSFKLFSNSSTVPDKYSGYFQTSANGLEYRLILHVATTTTNAFDLRIDNIKIAQSQQAYGAIITDWVDFPSVAAGTLITGSISNPTYGPIDYNRARWRRVGSNMEIVWEYRQTSPGTSGSGQYLFNLPPGYSIDSTKTQFSNSSSSIRGYVGTFNSADATTAHYTGYVGAVNATQLNFIFQYQNFGANTPGGAGLWASGFGSFAATDFILNMHASVPIQGWSASVKISDGFDGRDIILRASRPTAQVIGTTYSTRTTIVFDTVHHDTTGSYNSSTGVYTIPSSGFYEISASVSFQTATTATSARFLCVQKNGINGSGTELVPTQIIYPAGIGLVVHPITYVGYFNAGETVNIAALQETPASPEIGAFSATNQFFVRKIQSPQTIAQSEVVSAVYSSNVGQTIPNVTPTVVNYNIKIEDTHNAVTTGSNWKFTAPVSGIYEISGFIQTAPGFTFGVADEVFVLLRKNAVDQVRVALESSKNTHSVTIPVHCIPFQIKLNAGDYIDYVIRQNSGSSINLVSNSALVWISIKKIG